MNNVYKIFTAIDEEVATQQVVIRLNQMSDIYGRDVLKSAVVAYTALGFSRNKVIDRHLNNLKLSYVDRVFNDALDILDLNVKYGKVVRKAQ